MILPLLLPFLRTFKKNPVVTAFYLIFFLFTYRIFIGKQKQKSGKKLDFSKLLPL